MTAGSPAQAIADINNAQAAVREYLSRWREHVQTWTGLLAGVRSVFVTGRGDSLATAGTAGLILKDSTRHHAEGMSSPAFRHGPIEMVNDSVFLLVLAGEDRAAASTTRLMEDVARAGGRVALAATDGAGPFRLPHVSDRLLPIVEILPVQMISLALAAIDGREAGKFERASKVTTVE